jgi:hypothetical protein
MRSGAVSICDGSESLIIQVPLSCAASRTPLEVAAASVWMTSTPSEFMVEAMSRPAFASSNESAQAPETSMSALTLSAPATYAW